MKWAYDLGLLGAVEYRKAFKYISVKGWSKIEPHEPRFQQPELFEKALNGLGQKATLTIDLPIDKLCQELQFTPDTFRDVTGIVPPNRT